MQVILDYPFARPGSVPIGGGKKGEFRDWTNGPVYKQVVSLSRALKIARFTSEIFQQGLPCYLGLNLGRSVSIDVKKTR